MDPSDVNVATAFAYALQLAVGLVFIIAVVPKLLHPTAFAEVVGAYTFVPARALRILPFVLAPIELVVGVTLVTGFFVRFGLIVAFLTLVAFLATVLVALRHGLAIPCGCFGRTGEPISSRSVVRLSLLVVAAGIALALTFALHTSSFQPHAYALDSKDGLRLVLSVSTLGGFLVIAGLWILTVPEILFLARASVQDNEMTVMDDRVTKTG